MQLKLHEILLILVIFQLVFISVFLFCKTRGRGISNRLLGYFFLAIALSLADNFLLSTGIYYQYPAFAIWSGPVPLLYGPLLYLYTQSLLYKKFKLSIYKILHFLPFVIIFAMLATGYAIQFHQKKEAILHAVNGHQIPPYLYGIALLIAAHFFYYSVKALRVLNFYNAEALNKFSNSRQLNLKWLKNSIWFMMALFVIAIFNNLFQLTSFKRVNAVILTGIILLLLVFINNVLFKALQTPEIFSWMETDEMTPLVKPVTSGRYLDQLERVAALHQFMQIHKPYLNPNLTVEALATAMAMRPKEVSVLINTHLNQNFFDYVNRYRIREAQLMLTQSDDKKLTVLEVLYKTGFNSKSSFNTLFKKYSGLTPTDYKNQHN